MLKNQKRWQKGSLIFIYTMIDPLQNTEVYDEGIVGVCNSAFSKSFIDALLTQIRFLKCLHNFLPKLYTDLNLKDGAHQ